MSKKLFYFALWISGYVVLDAYRTSVKVRKREALRKPEVEGLEPIEVTRACLDACLEERLVGPEEKITVCCAGFRNFREPWARDFGFASFGLLAENRADVVEDGVRLFFRHQKSDGQLPLKLHSTVLVERYLHSFFSRVQPVDANLVPRFITAHGTRSLDSVLLLVIAWGECVVKTENHQLAVDLHGQVERALQWVSRYQRDRTLIHQGMFSDWADSIGRSGAILYTNVLWWKALRSLEQVNEILVEDLEHFPTSSKDVAESILARFYDDSLGYLKNSPSSDLFSSAGNFMAVAWGLTSSEQSNSILDFAAAQGISSPVPSKVTDRNYPWYLVGPEMWVAGISTYHTSCAWMWIGGWHAVALARSGRGEEAEETVERMLNIVDRDRTVYEVFDEQGSPLRTNLYQSEGPFSWSAGLMLHAYHEIQGLS